MAPAAPTIATVATPDFVLGAGQLSDNATVSGLVNPIAAQDEVVFRLYRGADCGTRTSSSRDGHVADYNAAPTRRRRLGRAVRSAGRRGPIAGGRSTAATTTTSRSRTVQRAQREHASCAPAAPTIATVATPDFVLGAGQLTDNATVSGLVNPLAAQDEVVFRLYRGADCAARTSSSRGGHVADLQRRRDAGAADSGAPFDPPGAGTYRWRAFYSGDDNNARSAARATRRTRTRSSRRRRRRSRRSRRRTSCSAPASCRTTRRSRARQTRSRRRTRSSSACIAARIARTRTSSSRARTRTLTYNARRRGDGRFGRAVHSARAGDVSLAGVLQRRRQQRRGQRAVQRAEREHGRGAAAPTIATVATPDFVLGAGSCRTTRRSAGS